MAGIFSFKCSCCGKQHEGSPSFGFKAPDPWLGQPEEVKQEGKIGDDLCFYTDEDGTHYFARVVIEIPIHGVSEPFMWGVWVSLSKESYEHYIETWDEPDLEKRTLAGFVANFLITKAHIHLLPMFILKLKAHALTFVYMKLITNFITTLRMV